MEKRLSQGEERIDDVVKGFIYVDVSSVLELSRRERIERVFVEDST